MMLIKKKIYQAFEQKLVPINTSISGINGEILTIKTNKTNIETIKSAIDIRQLKLNLIEQH